MKTLGSAGVAQLDLPGTQCLRNSPFCAAGRCWGVWLAGPEEGPQHSRGRQAWPWLLRCWALNPPPTVRLKDAHVFPVWVALGPPRCEGSILELLPESLGPELSPSLN